MKFLRALLLIENLLVSARAVVRPSNYFDNFKMSQFHTKNRDTDITFKVTSSGSDYVTVSLYIINDSYPDGMRFYKKTFLKTNTETTVYNNEYTRPSNNKIRIVYTHSKSSEETVLEHDVSITYGSTFKLTNSSHTYTSKSKYLTYKVANGWEELSQELIFNNFNDIYVPDYYHKIDLSEYYISFGKTYAYSLPYDEALFTVTNRNGVFNCFTHNEYYAEIPLLIVKDGTKFKLRFANTMYVDPLTLRMSLFPEKGFVETQHLYFPRNEKRYEDAYTCLITMRGVGMDCNNFSLNFRYKSTYNIMGDCRNSEYCIINV